MCNSNKNNIDNKNNDTNNNKNNIVSSNNNTADIDAKVAQNNKRFANYSKNYKKPLTNNTNNTDKENLSYKKGSDFKKRKFNNNRKKTTNDKNFSQYSYSRVLLTKRVDKVTSGGRNSSFIAIVVIGNTVDRVGIGTAYGNTVIQAIIKAKQNAIKRVIIPSSFSFIKHKFCASEVIIKKHKKNIIYSTNYLSAIFKACGLNNLSCKLIRSTNEANAIYCVFDALSQVIQRQKCITIMKQSINDKHEFN